MAWLFYTTGLLFWSVIACYMVSRWIRLTIFFYRLGWKTIRNMRTMTLIEIMVDPPEMFEHAYYPSRHGRMLKRMHDKQARQAERWRDSANGGC